MSINESLKEKIDLVKQQLPQSLNSVVRIEHGKGGLNLHRGFYCPSLAFDIVVGNASRGRILKQGGKNSQFDYEYGFDIFDRLIVVRKFHQGQMYLIEILLYSENVIEGYGFSKEDLTLCSYCREVYHDNKLMNFTHMYLPMGSLKYSHYFKESYIYTSLGLKHYEWIDFYPDFSSTKNCSLMCQSYCFEHDVNVYLSTYWLDNTSVDIDKSPYAIKIKRKI